MVEDSKRYRAAWRNQWRLYGVAKVQVGRLREGSSFIHPNVGNTWSDTGCRSICVLTNKRCVAAVAGRTAHINERLASKLRKQTIWTKVTRGLRCLYLTNANIGTSGSSRAQASDQGIAPNLVCPSRQRCHHGYGGEESDGAWCDSHVVLFRIVCGSMPAWGRQELGQRAPLAIGQVLLPTTTRGNLKVRKVCKFSGLSGHLP